MSEPAVPRRRRREGSDESADSGRRQAGAAAASSPPPRPTSGGRTLQSRLEELLGGLALPYSAMGDDYAAQLIATRTPAIAEAWADLAKQNAAVKRVLERLVQGTAWGGVVLSSAGLAIPLLAHHNILPLVVDPFSGMYGGAPVIPRRGDKQQRMPDWSPIVPPPPSSDSGMTPPAAPDQPSGTFTVAGSTNSAAMPPLDTE